jgi:hypothetical protein
MQTRLVFLAVCMLATCAIADELAAVSTRSLIRDADTVSRVPQVVEDTTGESTYDFDPVEHAPYRYRHSTLTVVSDGRTIANGSPAAVIEGEFPRWIDDASFIWSLPHVPAVNFFRRFWVDEYTAGMDASLIVQLHDAWCTPFLNGHKLATFGQQGPGGNIINLYDVTDMIQVGYNDLHIYSESWYLDEITALAFRIDTYPEVHIWTDAPIPTVLYPTGTGERGDNMGEWSIRLHDSGGYLQGQTVWFTLENLFNNQGEWFGGHGDHTHPEEYPRPMGGFVVEGVVDTLRSFAMVTDDAGFIHLPTYVTSQFNGREQLTIWVCPHETYFYNTIDSRVPGLVPVENPQTPTYLLTGETDCHGLAYNHWGTEEFVEALVGYLGWGGVAYDYYQHYGRPLVINDMSLPWGGKFEISCSNTGGTDWNYGSHAEHREGMNADINTRHTRNGIYYGIPLDVPPIGHRTYIDCLNRRHLNANVSASRYLEERLDHYGITEYIFKYSRYDPNPGVCRENNLGEHYHVQYTE